MVGTIIGVIVAITLSVFSLVNDADIKTQLKAEKKLNGELTKEVRYNRKLLGYHKEVFEGQEMVNERNDQNIGYNYVQGLETEDLIENTVFIPIDGRTGKPLGGGR